MSDKHPSEDGAEGQEQPQTMAGFARTWREQERETLRAAAPESFELGSEVELAETLLEYLCMCADGHEPVYTRGALWGFEPSQGLWIKVSEERLSQVLQAWDGLAVEAGHDQKGNPRYKPLRMSKRTISAVVSLLKDQLVCEDFFDRSPVGVAFADGLFACVVGGMIDIQRLSVEHRATWSLACPYAPHLVELLAGSQWSGFLSSLFEGETDANMRIDALQEFVGGALFGLTPGLQRAMLLTGSGSNGKSAFLNVIEALFPEEARIGFSPQELTEEGHRAQLVGRAINIVRELPARDLIETQHLKAIITGETITARHLFERPFNFRPRAAHIFSANALPAVADRSHGQWRRWLVVHFGRLFGSQRLPSGQVIEGATVVQGMAERILEGELALVAAWAVQGAMRLLKQGDYTDPPTSNEALDEWREDTDHLVAFCREQLLPDEKSLVSSDGWAWSIGEELHTAYWKWCWPDGASGRKRVHRPLDKQTFLKEMKAVVISKKKGGGYIRYRCGIRAFPTVEVL